MSNPSPRSSLTTLWVGVIVLAGMVVYLGAVGNDFVFDDHPMIEERALILQPTLSSFEEVLLSHYRPVREAALMAVAAVGGPYPISFHLANIFLHLINAVLVFAVAFLLTRSNRMATLSSLFFTVHPIQTDAVAYASGLRDTLSTGFVLAGLCAFMAHRRKSTPIRWVAALGFLVLGIATKEMAVGLIALFFLYDLQSEISRVPDRSVTGGLRSIGSVLKRHCLFYVLMTGVILLALFFYLFVHHSSVRIQGAGIFWWGGSFGLNALTVPMVWVTYLEKLVYPLPLLADYMGYPLVAVSWTDGRAWASWLVLVGVFFIAFRLLLKHPVAGFALSWVLVTLAPVVQIFPHHELMAEHHLYLPSVGFCLLLAFGIDRLMDRSSLKWAVGAVSAVLVVTYAAGTVKRIGEWRNDLTLFESNLRDFPNAPRSYMQLGNYYQAHNLFRSARDAYEKSISLRPDFAMAHNNLGVLLYKSGHPEAAIIEYRKALNGELGAYLPAYGNLARAYLVTGKTGEAVQVLKEGMARRPDDPKLVASLYFAFRKAGDEAAVDRYLSEWIRLSPNDPVPIREKAESYKRRMDFDAAIALYDQLIRNLPSDDQLKAQRSRLMDSKSELDTRVRRIREGQGTADDYLKTAEIYDSLGALDRETDILADGLKRFTGNPALAKSYLKQRIKKGGPVPGSQDPIDELIRRFRTDPEIEVLSAAVLAQSDRVASAYRLAREAVGRFPPDRRLGNNIFPEGDDETLCDQSRILSRVFDAAGLPETALDLLDRPACREANPEDDARRASLLLRLNKTDEAVREYEAAIKPGPGTAGIHAALGMMLVENIGDYESAGAHLNEAIRLDPQIKGAPTIESMAARLEKYVKAVRSGEGSMELSVLSSQIGQMAAEYKLSVFQQSEGANTRKDSAGD